MESEQIIESVWQLFLSVMNEAGQEVAPELQSWLSQQTRNAAANALTLDPTHGWTTKDMHDLAHAVVDDFRPAKRAEMVLGRLDGLVQCWQRVTKIVVPPLRNVFRLKRARNPWQQDVVGGLQFWSQAKADLERAIKSSSNNPDFDVLALGMASGIIQLDLLHSDCIIAVLHSLADPVRNLAWLGDSFVIRQSLAVRGVPDSEHRIYLPDPLTATLLEQVEPAEARSILDATGSDAKDTPDLILHALSARIDAALALGQKGRKRRYSVDNLSKHCTAAALYWRSPVTVAYLRRRLISHSPSLETLLRIEPSCLLLSLRPERSVEARSVPFDSRRMRSIGADADVENQPAAESAKNNKKELRWFDLLRVALAGINKRKARQRLSRLLATETLPVAGRCLAGFASWLLSGSRSKGRNLRTIRDGLSLLARFLFPLFEDDENPATAAKTGIEDLYFEAIAIHQESPAGQSISSQMKFVKWIVRFHDYLVAEHGAKPLEELRSMAAGCLPVDANLLMEDEFVALKEAIRTSPLIPIAQRVIAELLAIIAVRCGLRHSEAFWLRPCDIDLGSRCMLLVQPYSLRGLKTRNALRRLNLTGLLHPDELKLLLAFQSQHQSQPLSPMFVAASGQGLLDEDEIFAAIHHILRETLGDRGLRFHHGRHSFGSFLALRILSESPESYKRFFPSRPATLALLKDSAALRQALYGSDEVEISVLDGLANMIGHAVAKFSVAHYIHTLCFLTAVELAQESEFACDLPTLIAASRLPASSAYRCAKQGVDAIPAHIFQKRFHAQIQVVADQRCQQAKTAPHTRTANRVAEAVAIACSLLCREQSLDEIRASNHDPEVVELVLSAWREVSSSNAEEAKIHEE
jgi:integrase